FTTSFCPYCSRAKYLLESKGVQYEEINLDDDPEKKLETMQKLNWRTVPIILIGGELIGGYDQLAALERSDKLDELLN
ncbi:MAG: glutaredoxin domain-containing protein, partial [Thermodesulfobacteriota bacterium]